MNRIHSVAVSAALIVWSLPLARAGSKPSKPKDASAVAQAKAIFEQIDASSAEIAEVAEGLETMAKGRRDPEMHLEGLDTLKQDVNSIGSELSSLDAERASLAPWEVEALDRTTSLMHDVATHAEQAIETFSADRDRLWATSYPADTAKAAEDANQVKTLLAHYLKLAKVHEREDRLEHDLSGSQQF